ncbi:hypothetical protein HMPREF9148_00686 [Prevotella sp. F0091]|nr:hypothetical protein HMPREF9148_00686 [Prevotella sp. F0091]
MQSLNTNGADGQHIWCGGLAHYKKELLSMLLRVRIETYRVVITLFIV